MLVKNMTSSKGNIIANQFIISDSRGTFFQSYESIIAFIPKKYVLYDGTCEQPNDQHIQLDEKYWNYSRTTSKYRCLFLGETTKETERKIKSGEYILTNLN